MPRFASFSQSQFRARRSRSSLRSFLYSSSPSSFSFFSAFSAFSVLSAFILSSLLLLTAGVARAQVQNDEEPARIRPKVRAITAFIQLDREKYREQVAGALEMLKYAKTVFETRGYEVQTIRISTQPFPEYTREMTDEQVVAFFREYDALAARENFDASIGPALLRDSDDPTLADRLAKILRNTKILNSSIVVAGEDGVHWKSIGAAARVIKTLSRTTEHSQGNFRFSAIALVPPLTPFYPGSYHTGFGHQFAVALESANLVQAAFQDADDLDAATAALRDSLVQNAQEIERLAGRVDRDTGWAYAGLDLSPAPLKDVSIGAAIESLTQMPFGASGTLTAAAQITAVLKQVGVKQTGYSGLMLPILEDARLARRWSEGLVSTDALLAYSAVCGTGLDVLPLPGDISEERLALIIGDVASLAVKWHKPLSARLLPVAGKKPGDLTEFDDPFLVNARIQPLPENSVPSKE